MAEITKRLDRAEVAKRVERAEKLLQKGKTGDALEEYMQILTVDPQNEYEASEFIAPSSLPRRPGISGE